MPLRTVHATATGLVVSSLRREVLVPYGQIASVWRRPFIGLQPITVELHPGSPLDRFVFAPRSWTLFGEHPVVKLLRERAAAARAAAPTAAAP